MKIVLILMMFLSSVNALQTSDRLFDCTEIFKERKGELLVELERIDEQQQALSALKSATEELLKKKETRLTLQEEEINNKLLEITQKETATKKMLEKNVITLKELKSTKMTKIAQTFAKMKAGAASGILSKMDAQEAVAILRALKPKTVGQILTKMEAKKASQLTLILTK
ncbi:MAG: PDP protein [Sulfurimonas sp.]|nr:PDP protein [Sulfurimonas sp.]MDQ7060383.1 PDP protein [Sulfurimonas sp.]